MAKRRLFPAKLPTLEVPADVRAELLRRARARPTTLAEIHRTILIEAIRKGHTNGSEVLPAVQEAR